MHGNFIIFNVILADFMYFQNCHNPTNNTKQLKTTFVGVVLLSVGKTTPHNTTLGIITIWAILGNLGI
jgi:hypothetical protein